MSIIVLYTGYIIYTLCVLDQDNSSAPTSAAYIIISVVVGIPAIFIFIAVCAALVGRGRNSWFLCGKNQIMKRSPGGAKRQSGTGQRRIPGGKFLDSSLSARGRGNDMVNSSNVQQQQLSCDLQSRYIKIITYSY